MPRPSSRPSPAPNVHGPAPGPLRESPDPEVIDLWHERANAVTHGLGLVASLVGGAVLLVLAVGSADAWRIASTAVFATTLVLLYAASTLYHAARSGHLRARFKLLDHCAIYLLIAGTYTPFALVGLRGGWGWSLFGVAWGMAAVGIIFKLLFLGRFQYISTATYVAMGWMALVVTGPMIRSLDSITLVWIVTGGVVYTVGTWFYLDERIPYNHAIWHLFVLGGSVCHGLAVASQL